MYRLGPWGTAFLKDARAPAAWSALTGTVVVIITAGLGGMWSEGGALGWLAWLTIVLLSIPSSMSLLVPVVSMVAASATMARWRREGAWIGLKSVGINGARLLPALLVLSLFSGGMAAVGSLKVEPDARRAMAGALYEAVSHVQLWPGITTEIDGVSILPRSQDEDWFVDLFFATPELVGSAKRARVMNNAGVATVDLHQGQMIGTGDRAVMISFERWRRPVGIQKNRRLELDQRTTRELMSVASRTQATGNDANYEWAVLYKRFLHPLSVIFLTLGALPAGASRRVHLSIGLAAIGYLVAVRMGDHLNTVLGAGLGASTGLLFSVVWAIVAWYRWDDR